MADTFSTVLSGGILGSGGQSYGSLSRREERVRQGLVRTYSDLINKVFGGGTGMLYTPVSKDQLPRGWGGGTPGPYYTMGRGRNTNFVPYQGSGTQPSRVGGAMGTGAAGGAVLGPAGAAFGASVGGGVQALREGDFASAAFGGLPSLFGGGGETPEEKLRRYASHGMLFTGSPQTYQGFDEGFFNKRMQDYINFALPELNRQFGTTRNNILYGLANRGLLGSSAARQQQSELNRTYLSNQKQIADTGRAQSQQLKTDIENQRDLMLSRLYMGADPGGTLQSAISTASQFRQPSAWPALTDMFGNLINQYAQQRFLTNVPQTTQAPQYTPFAPIS